MKRLSLLASVLLFTAAHAPAADAPAAAAQLNTMYAEFWEENLKLNPITATFAGDPRYNAELPNFSRREFEQETRAFQQKYLDRARAIGAGGLAGQDRLSYDIFTLNRESALEELEFPGPAAAHRPVPQHRQFVRAARLRHERAAVRDREGLRRLAEARRARAPRFSTRPS